MGYITTNDFSLVVGTSPVTVPLQFPGLGVVGSPGRYAQFMRITNVAAQSVGTTETGTSTASGSTTTEAETTTPTALGGTIWLSRAGVAVVNGAGSYPLLPGQSQEFRAPREHSDQPAFRGGDRRGHAAYH